MNAIRFAVYTGLIWAGASLLLIELSILSGSETAWVELDFRLISGIVFIVLHSLDFQGHVSELIQYIQYGMPINAVNSIVALITGFIDGFVSGFFIAIFYNFLSIISEDTEFPTTIKFGIATGIVLGICSMLLGIVGMLYSFDIPSFGFAIRPVYLIFLGISHFVQVTPASALSVLSDSYLMFPHDYGGVFEWGFWGFIDGLLGGIIVSYIFLLLKKRLRP